MKFLFISVRTNEISIWQSFDIMKCQWILATLLLHYPKCTIGWVCHGNVMTLRLYTYCIFISSLIMFAFSLVSKCRHSPCNSVTNKNPLTSQYIFKNRYCQMKISLVRSRHYKMFISYYNNFNCNNIDYSQPDLYAFIYVYCIAILYIQF